MRKVPLVLFAIVAIPPALIVWTIIWACDAAVRCADLGVRRKSNPCEAP